MKNRLIAMLLVIIALLAQSACSIRNEKKVVKTYIMDLQSQSVKEILSSKSFPDQVEWAEDGRRFMLVERVPNRIGDNFFVRVFQGDDFKEIEVPKQLNENKHTHSNAHWADSNRLLVSIPVNGNWKYYIFDLEYGDIKLIKEEETGSYLSLISETNEKLSNRMDIPNKDDMRRELRNKIGTDYNEGILSLDSSKFLYSTEVNNVSLYDIKSDKNEELFKGFDLRWSMGETMIAYAVPKNINISEFQRRTISTGSEMETYVYDLEKRQSIKVADFYAKVFFSPDDRYIIFYPVDFVGVSNV